MKHTGLFLVAIAGLFATVGDLFMKKWVVTNVKYLLVLGFCIWSIGGIFLAFSFKHKNIAVASLMMILFNITALAIVSWIYFKEPLSGYQITGLTLGLLAVVLLETF